MPSFPSKTNLEDLYQRYNRLEVAQSDPVSFVHCYSEGEDREVVGLIAACLAYGRVEQILKSIAAVLGRLGPSPAECLRRAPRKAIHSEFEDFRHRVTSGTKLATLLTGVADVLTEFGSLEACFQAGRECEGEDLLSALSWFVYRLDLDRQCDHLLPMPRKGSACKRLHLYLRWMVRRDEVDPGVWRCLRPADLLIPLDVHLHRWALNHGATERKQPDEQAAVEVTRAFAAVRPDDPARYDFALAHAGMEELRSQCR
jgi:uncharacterized protein (TIGR02757 family)